MKKNSFSKLQNSMSITFLRASKSSSTSIARSYLRELRLFSTIWFKIFKIELFFIVNRIWMCRRISFRVSTLLVTEWTTLAWNSTISTRISDFQKCAIFGWLRILVERSEDLRLLFDLIPKFFFPLFQIVSKISNSITASAFMSEIIYTQVQELASTIKYWSDDDISFERKAVTFKIL